MAPVLALTLLLATPQAVTPEFEEVVHQSMTDYTLGYYGRALKEAEAAYRQKPLPALLFNLGQCHRALKHWERAESFYRSFLHNEPNAKNRELVLGLIDKMVANEKEAAEHPAPAPAAPAPSLVLVEAAPPAAVAPPDAAVTAAPPPRSRVWPWVLGSGAVIFSGAAVWGWYEAASFSSYKATPHSYSQISGQQTLATAGEVTGIAGAVVAAALLTGAVLTW